ncbi:MAG: DUF4382 domain-containing protein [Desulfuromonas sp.]|nr:DUF4382 domain-containing protein [Desulfuromonas sp.]
MAQRKSWWLLSALILVSSFVLFACGGGGGSSSSSASTGSVGVLVTDGPSDIFKAIEVTIDGVSLIDDEDNLIEIWSDLSGKTVDLLNLETEAELFTLAGDVPVGWYNKIRLHISAVDLVEFNDNLIAVEVPSAKIDLNPRGQFYVSADETLLVQLDFDANKVIHLVNPGHYRLRPVVFVDILTAKNMGRLVRLPGIIDSVDGINSQFVLLHQSAEFLIYTDNDTLFFGPDGIPTAFADLDDGDEVIAIGHFRAGSDDTQPEFDAVLVEEGDYQKLRGTLTVAPGATGTSLTLVYNTDPPIVVNLDDDTAFYDCFGVMIAKADLVVGQRVAVDAVMFADEYYAALVVACPDSVDTLSGELEAIELLTLTVEGQCAEEANGASYYLLGEDTLTEITRADLTVGDTLLLFGDDGVCFSYRQLFNVE